MKVEVEMKLKKSTKNTNVYVAEGEAVPTIYIQKDSMPEEVPKEIMLTVFWYD